MVFTFSFNFYFYIYYTYVYNFVLHVNELDLYNFQVGAQVFDYNYHHNAHKITCVCI